MKSKQTGMAGLVAAFVAGMVVATALGGWASAGSKMPGGTEPGHQVAVPSVISPTITDEDIALLRQDLRAKKMQVIGENMSLSDTEAQKFWPVYNHYVKDLQEVNNQKYALLKQYAHMWSTMTDQDAVIYVRNWLEVDQQVQALRVKYVPAVNQVLSGKKAATEHDHRPAIIFADPVGKGEGDRSTVRALRNKFEATKRNRNAVVLRV